MDDLIDRDAVIGCLDSNAFSSYENAVMTRHKIEDIPAVNRWIPCSDRLPGTKNPCAVVTENGGLGVSRMLGRNRMEWTLFGERVIYWMPLPEPPEKG